MAYSKPSKPKGGMKKPKGGKPKGGSKKNC